MNKILLILLIFASPLTQAKCDKKIDPKKVILFIDTNTSTPEIEKAEAGACARGERLVVIPKNHREYDQLYVEHKKVSKDLSECFANSGDSSKCAEQIKKQNDISAKISELKSKSLRYNVMLKNELEELKKNKAKLVSFIISGHDGGGFFGGMKGYFGRSDVQNVLKDYPEENKVQSALLLGCYTGVKHEIGQWQSVFPDLKLMGGYDSSAPLSERPAGQKYVQELLTNEKKLLAKTDQKKLEKKLFSSIKSIGDLRAGVYIKPTCVTGTDAEAFYYGSQSKEKGLEPIVVGECEKKEVVDEIRDMETAFSKYQSGELEPPLDSTNGELRKIYNRARKFEHCLTEKRSSVTLNQVFNLLFFNGIKESFADFYKNDLKLAEENLKDLNPDEVIKNQEKMIKDWEDQNALLASENEILEKTPEKYIEKKTKEYEGYNKKYDQLLNDPAYANVLEKIPELKTKESYFSLMNSSLSSLSKEDQAKAYEFYSLRGPISIAKFYKENASDDRYREQLIRANRDQINNMTSAIANFSVRLEQLKKDPSVLKNVWVPTADNLKTKSRKEILENLYKIDAILYTPGIPPKHTATLAWVRNVTSNHLQYFQNPFSWHEHTENVEPPLSVNRLQTALDSVGGTQSYGYGYGTMGGGMYGGFFRSL